MLDPGITKRLPLQPVASAFGIEPKEKEITTAMKAMANARVVRSGDLPVELLKIGLEQDQTILVKLHRLTTLIWRKGKVPQQWKGTVFTILHKRSSKTECGNYRGILLVSHVGNLLLEVIVMRLGAYCETMGLVLEER